ncbi:MAG: hypothetical protein M1834_003344 [Cirrosporium novae-zelandiae]|nr:MAG: hypothetical protein M1834_003344 [Cirrosporium novae-zelandiae]
METHILPELNRDIAEVVAIGTIAVIYALDKQKIVKRYFQSSNNQQRNEEDAAYNIEIRAYRRLGDHPRIAHFYGVTSDGIVLERGECLRKRYREVKISTIPPAQKLRWAEEAAEGLLYIHQNGIVQADVGCHNLILDSDGHIKFIDFGGSSIDGQEAIVCYEWCSYRPATPEISVQTDIFAFGSTLFEIESGHPPYHELEVELSIGQLGARVQGLYAANEFPPVQNLLLGNILQRCWNGEYKDMDDVMGDIRKLRGLVENSETTS